MITGVRKRWRHSTEILLEFYFGYCLYLRNWCVISLNPSVIFEISCVDLSGITHREGCDRCVFVHTALEGSRKGDAVVFGASMGAQMVF